MTNEEEDRVILTALRNDARSIENLRYALVSAGHGGCHGNGRATYRCVENSLRRLKRRGRVAWHQVARKWEYVQQ